MLQVLHAHTRDMLLYVRHGNYMYKYVVLYNTFNVRVGPTTCATHQLSSPCHRPPWS